MYITYIYMERIYMYMCMHICIYVFFKALVSDTYVMRIIMAQNILLVYTDV